MGKWKLQYNIYTNSVVEFISLDFKMSVIELVSFSPKRFNFT